jgi:hypothetical protein
VAKHEKQALEDEPEIPQNPLKHFHNASFQPGNGKIYDKKPFRMKLEKGKTYVWCLCGQSKSQVLNRLPSYAADSPGRFYYFSLHYTYSILFYLSVYRGFQRAFHFTSKLNTANTKACH